MQEAEKKQKINQEIKEWLKTIGVSFVFALLIITFARPTMVDGQSMEPTLNHSDILIINRFSYQFQKPEVGDIVAFHSDLSLPGGEQGETMDLIKRVIGVTGDEILIEDGIVSVNGEVLEEDYLFQADVTAPDMQLTVPEGTVFVMGDNRTVSKDSRSSAVGAIDEKEILGKAYFRLYPFTKIGGI